MPCVFFCFLFLGYPEARWPRKSRAQIVNKVLLFPEPPKLELQTAEHLEEERRRTVDKASSHKGGLSDSNAFRVMVTSELHGDQEEGLQQHHIKQIWEERACREINTSRSWTDGIWHSNPSKLTGL